MTPKTTAQPSARKPFKECSLPAIETAEYQMTSQGGNHDYVISISVPYQSKAQAMPGECENIWMCDTTKPITHNGWNYLNTLMDKLSCGLINCEVSEQTVRIKPLQLVSMSLPTEGRQDHAF